MQSQNTVDTLKVARSPYRNVNVEMPPEYSEYETYEIEWGNQDRYEITRKIGRGKYSDVFEGWDTEADEKVIIKILKPVKKRKIRREIKILTTLNGGPNIVGVVEIVRDTLSRVPAIIFEAINNVDYRALWPSFTLQDIRYYCYQLLKALDHCHSRGIIHRDVKPNNLVIDPIKKQLKLIDFGLAEFYIPGVPYNVRVASRFFKGPELLVNFQYYDYSLDLWSFGCVLAGLIFGREPFFRGQNNVDQLVKIVKVLGTDDFYAYLSKYSISLDWEIERAVGTHQKKPFLKFVTETNQHLVSSDALNLIKSCLQYDHQERPTAREAMFHPFFNSVREEYDPDMEPHAANEYPEDCNME
ncbi:hypothetical protein PCE1_000867 [Barthelona sp. PCE]